jgi:hypothetical protein
MSFAITGTLLIAVKGREVEIDASDFSLEEGGYLHGQHGALFKHFDTPDVEITVNAYKVDGGSVNASVKIEGGDILSDDLDVEWDESDDDD